MSWKVLIMMAMCCACPAVERPSDGEAADVVALDFARDAGTESGLDARPADPCALVCKAWGQCELLNGSCCATEDWMCEGTEGCGYKDCAAKNCWCW